MDHGLKCKIIKLLRKNIRENFRDLELFRVLALIPKTQSIKGKMGAGRGWVRARHEVWWQQHGAPRCGVCCVVHSADPMSKWTSKWDPAHLLQEPRCKEHWLVKEKVPELASFKLKPYVNYLAPVGTGHRQAPDGWQSSSFVRWWPPSRKTLGMIPSAWRSTASSPRRRTPQELPTLATSSTSLDRIWPPA